MSKPLPYNRTQVRLVADRARDAAEAAARAGASEESAFAKGFETALRYMIGDISPTPDMAKMDTLTDVELAALAAITSLWRGADR